MTGRRKRRTTRLGAAFAFTAISIRGLHPERAASALIPNEGTDQPLRDRVNGLHAVKLAQAVVADALKPQPGPLLREARSPSQVERTCNRCRVLS